MSPLLDQLRTALRARHYSRRTEEAYCLWVRRYVRFHGLRHPAEMAEPEINAFLTHLAVAEHVSAATQTQALSALLFLYRRVLGRRIGELGDLVRANQPRRLPVRTKRGVVHILRNGREVATLRAGPAARFISRAEGASYEVVQQLCARATGNYRRGNEAHAAAMRSQGRDA